MSHKRIEGPVYVTKWALTRGILVYPNGGEVVDGKYFKGARSYSDPAYCWVGPKDWTQDAQKAQADAVRKAMRKVKNLNKALKKMQAIIENPTTVPLVEKAETGTNW